MTTATQSRLSLLEAAKLIYGRVTLSASQLEQVRRQLEQGELKGERTKRGWTTTPEAVAALMADHACGPRDLDPAKAARRMLGSMEESGEQFYRDMADPEVRYQVLEIPFRKLAQEYFLAVVLRRQSQIGTAWFRRAVTAGQAALVTCVLAIVVWSAASLTASPSPEQVAINSWLQSNHPKRVTVRRWHDPQPNPSGEGLVVRVDYRYHREGRRGVETTQYFCLVDNQVVQVDSEI